MYIVSKSKFNGVFNLDNFICIRVGPDCEIRAYMNDKDFEIIEDYDSSTEAEKALNYILKCLSFDDKICYLDKFKINEFEG